MTFKMTIDVPPPLDYKEVNFSTFPPIPDPVTTQFPHCQYIRVTLDGAIQKYCVEASVSGCYVKRHKLDPDGYVYVDPGTLDLAIERVRGRVTVEYHQHPCIATEP